MKIKKIVVFTTLVLGVALAGWAMQQYWNSYKVSPSLENQNQDIGITKQPAEKGVDCSTLFESDCLKSLDCNPKYGSSCPVCTDIRYLGCKLDPKKKDRKRTCEESGGTWNYEKRYNCDCSEEKGKYLRGSFGSLGCLSNEELCQQTDGIYTDSCTCPKDHRWEWTFGCIK